MPRFYRHKQISRFTVGQFNFTNHIAQIEDKDHDEFLKEFEGLQGVDKVNIVEVLNIQNERPVQRVIKGPLDVLNTVDSSIGHMQRASDMRNESTAQELKERQAALDAREKELNELAAKLGIDNGSGETPAPENNESATVVDEPTDPAPAPEPAKPAPNPLPTGLRTFGVKPVDAVDAK